MKGKPSQKELNRISRKIGGNWRSLLTELGLEQATIEGFLQSKFGDTSEACFKGLSHWLDGNADKPVTWDTLLKALRDSCMEGIAKDLEEGITKCVILICLQVRLILLNSSPLHQYMTLCIYCRLSVRFMY